MQQLNTLHPGEKAIIVEMNMNSQLKRRLNDLGFLENSHIECLFISFCGDPTAYGIKGSVIALRNSDASKIMIEITQEDDNEK